MNSLKLELTGLGDYTQTAYKIRQTNGKSSIDHKNFKRSDFQKTKCSSNQCFGFSCVVTT